jgi:predicted RNA-binding Zn-ribbon protein involved in translation (DUF1610 family)
MFINPLVYIKNSKWRAKMTILSEKMAYLKGMAEGLEVGDNSKEGKLLVEIIKVIDEICFTIDDVEEQIEEVAEYVEAIDESLTDIEEDLYEGEDEELYDSFECPDCGEEILVFEDEFLDDDFLEIQCPNCGSEFVVCDDGNDTHYFEEEFDNDDEDDFEACDENSCEGGCSCGE